MLPNISGGHSAYQNFVLTNLRKYYPDSDAIARSTWDIIDRFWNLDLSYTDEDNLSSHLHPLKSPVKNPSKKGAKAQPVEKVTIEQLLKALKIRLSPYTPSHLTFIH